MAQASPGQAPRKAPRFPTTLLAAMEDMVHSVDTPTFLKVMAWWLLVQSWETLRFDDHRGLLPRDFNVSTTGLLAKLSRSKVSGPDKRLNFRIVVIHSSAYVQHKNWLSVGWELLQRGAPYERDYLLPAPSNNFRGFKTGAEICHGFRSVNSGHLSCDVPWFENLFRAAPGIITHRIAVVILCLPVLRLWD